MAPASDAATTAHLRLVRDEARDSFRRVYADNYDVVWRLLRALGVPAAQLDDATQDVFMVVHRRLPTFDHAAPVRRWVLGIARKVALKVHERRRRPEPSLALVEAEAPDAETFVARRDAANVVARFLDTLEPEQREVFVLSQLEDMPVPEIAQTLGIKLNTAYSRLRLARRRFDRLVSRHAARRRRSR